MNTHTTVSQEGSDGGFSWEELEASLAFSPALVRFPSSFWFEHSELIDRSLRIKAHCAVMRASVRVSLARGWSEP